MTARIRILSAALAGAVLLNIFRLANVAEHYAQLTALRLFEIAYRLYSFPV
jgi:hypothetical protein